MKIVKRVICIIIVVTTLISIVIPTGAISFNNKLIAVAKPPEIKYVVPKALQNNLAKTYNKYNFSVGWGLYDISGSSLKTVASYNAGKSFQSNCTIKAVMLLYICKLMDAGKLSLNTKLSVNKSKLHYTDFKQKSGKYSVEYLATQMIHVSNNVCFEVFNRYVKRENFNAFMKSMGSTTALKSYTYMGNCITSDRAKEWFNIYKYCHSGAKHSAFAWKLLTEAKYSPIRDGLGVTVAHKSGWYNGKYGTAADCAVVQSKNGGCYLLVIFTKRNSAGNYSEALIRDLAKNLDLVWNDYYGKLLYPKVAKF